MSRKRTMIQPGNTTVSEIRPIRVSGGVRPLDGSRASVPGGGNWVASILVLVMLALLAACSAGGNGSGNATRQQEGSSSTGATAVVPTSSKGAPGKGPQVIVSPTPVPGGRPGSQQIVLADRTLVIVSATRQRAPAAGAALISLVLTVRNTGAKAIMNLPGYFQLTSSGGDVFGYQYNSSDGFYSPIAAHTSRDGLIVFELPAAALNSGLRLLYRPEVAAEVVIAPLKVV